ncbi:MAG: acyl-CoA thioester hydrolase/BAAT C-terminal domain-containing protein [Pseudomonadota bacterium]|nr:acyl-CoA thioester hydrolase/BAAT C-terminal domain-containing protein [Pseudomonadota bacterium]
MLLIISGLTTGCVTFSNNLACSSNEVLIGETDFKVQLTHYDPEGKSLKSILILPPTGGTNLIDRSYAKEFCAKGYDVYILNTWTDKLEESPDLEYHQRFYTRGQKAISRVLAEVKTPFVGLLGTSIGALHSSIAATTVEKIDAVFIIVGGAPIAEIVLSSDQQQMIDLKYARKKLYGFKNDQENIEAIGKAFQLEPMQQGTLYKKKDLGMSIAKNDETVPTINQNKLRDYWQPKKVVSLSSNHFFGILKTWLFHTDELVSFFEESFSSRQK